MPVKQEISEGRVPVRIYTDEVEPQARLHLGISATVGDFQGGA